MNKNHITISMVLFMMVVSGCLGLLCLTSCKKGEKIMEDYPSLTDKNHILKYTSIDEVIKKLDNGYNGIIMFGFKACPWCQAAISYVNEIAKEKNYSEVLYLDIKDMRDNEVSSNHEKYLQLFDRLKEDLGNPPKLYAPTVIVFKKGLITGYNVATVTSHQIIDGVLPSMTKIQIEELKEIYRNIF